MNKSQDTGSSERISAEPPRFLTPEDLADLLGVPVATLYAWRYHSKGPPALRIGRHLRYPVKGLLRWLDERSKADARD